MSKKKICFIAQFPPPIHGLSKAVDTLYNSNLVEEFEFEKVDITNNKHFFKNIISILKSNADLFYFTISQTKGGNLRDLIILKILSLQHKRCLIHLHGGYYRKLVDNDLPGWQRTMNYKSIKKLQGAIVLGPTLRSIFKGMINENKISVVPNCIDNEFLISDKEFQEKMDAVENKEVLNVLYLSNFIRSKGYSEVLEMAKLEKARVDLGGKQRFHFDFAGKFFEESEQGFFQTYIRENKLQDFITYHGIVGGQQKKELLKQSDIFILLTSYKNEGQPISILEAMGNGMVIVTTDHAGIPDIVEDEINGIVVKTENIKNTNDIYKSLERLNLKEIAVCNRKITKELYSEENYLNLMQLEFRQN
ncbi:glycosyltransferase family 4 protein [Bacillus sp. BRMEA1]|uniref:glycosyltransferase family 4 protein n=1 Tax=Neobacillus endophyticus TaxID=2738405 RepID=UPI001565C396|nr:glycosyltransferase family 4 protein [Neobacillus endophyticus]NRD76949.1 glycosyltransferase family 4 protein [Neobacillus endophyticus]